MKIAILLLTLILILNISAQEINGTQEGGYIYSKPFKISKKEMKYIHDDVYFEFFPIETPKREYYEYYDYTIKDSSEYFTAKMINLNSAKVFDNTCGNLMIIQEALDSLNRWRPIEYHVPAMCGNCNDNPLFLNKYEYVIIPVKKYSGDFKTKIRLKLRNRNSVYYSTTFDASINYMQFKENIEKSRSSPSDNFLEDNPFRD